MESVRELSVRHVRNRPNGNSAAVSHACAHSMLSHILCLLLTPHFMKTITAL